jgi:hypothetical protein
MKLFDREPAAIIAAVASLLSVLSAFWLHWSDDQVGTVNTVLGGLTMLAALGLKSDRFLPVLLGVVQAVFYAAVAFGYDLPAEKQALLLSAVSMTIAVIFVRPQVTAKAPASAA